MPDTTMTTEPDDWATSTTNAITLKKPKAMTMDEIHDAREEMAGYCIGCGEIAEDSCEPDAHEYDCSACGEAKVYGVEELVIMGLVTVA